MPKTQDFEVWGREASFEDVNKKELRLAELSRVDQISVPRQVCVNVSISVLCCDWLYKLSQQAPKNKCWKQPTEKCPKE